MVDPRLKVSSLLVQWVRRLVVSPHSWASFLTHYVAQLGFSLEDVLRYPLAFDFSSFPPSYCSLLTAWRLVDGTWSSSHIFCDSFFLSLKVAHGVLYTADCLIGFGYSLDPLFLCGLAPECLSHLFFSCPLAHSVLSWLQSLPFTFSSSCPSLMCRHVLFGFAQDELRSVPCVFVYLLNVCKFFIWLARNDFRFQDVRPGEPGVIAKVRARVRFHLLIFFRRFRSHTQRRFFHPQWGASRTIGRVSDGILSLSDF